MRQLAVVEEAAPTALNSTSPLTGIRASIRVERGSFASGAARIPTRSARPGPSLRQNESARELSRWSRSSTIKDRDRCRWVRVDGCVPQIAQSIQPAGSPQTSRDYSLILCRMMPSVSPLCRCVGWGGSESRTVAGPETHNRNNGRRALHRRQVMCQWPRSAIFWSAIFRQHFRSWYFSRLEDLASGEVRLRV
jgi:hypothetical protein